MGSKLCFRYIKFFPTINKINNIFVEAQKFITSACVSRFYAALEIILRLVPLTVRCIA